MSTYKYIDRICVIGVVVALLITVLFMNGEALGVQAANRTMGYETRLFDNSYVHEIDIIIDDWDEFIETCTNELYVPCDVVIDGETVKDVGIRAKGNSSLSGVASMGSERYSFKVEFDQYDNTKTYHGLDKLELNNLIYDNTMMKDYVVYQMMAEFGVAAPMCSYVYITVNGEDHGLYLAVESIEESFLQRNYGNDYGELYKPRSFNAELGQMAAGAAGADGDNADTAGGRGNMMNGMMGNRGGMGGFGSIDLDTIREALETQGIDTSFLDELDGENLDMMTMMQLFSELPEEVSQALREAMMGGMMGGNAAVPGANTDGETNEGNAFGNMMGGMSSDEVKLKYLGDDPDSYSGIFGNAKTDITKADQTRLIEALEIVNNGGEIESAVDVEQLIRYFVVNNFVVNGDSYTGTMVNNFYLYEKDGQLTLLPWDYNMAFGGFMGSSSSAAINEDIDNPVSTGVDDRPMLAWIFDSEEYTQLYHQYFTEFLETVDINAIIDEAEALIAPYVEQDPKKFCTYEEFELGVDTLRQFCDLRCESIENQLSGSSETVDTSTLDLGNMGSQGGGMMGGRGNMNFEDFMPMPEN